MSDLAKKLDVKQIKTILLNIILQLPRYFINNKNSYKTDVIIFQFSDRAEIYLIICLALNRLQSVIIGRKTNNKNTACSRIPDIQKGLLLGRVVMADDS